MCAKFYFSLSGHLIPTWEEGQTEKHVRTSRVRAHSGFGCGRAP